MKEIRLLRADEIEIRTASVNDFGTSLLLYKSARCDQAVLDETFGRMNWQRHHSRDNANCIVSVWDEEKHCWVEKEDTGTEANNQREKSIASDSFKRACVNWGIGRELYTAPFIWIPAEKTVIKEERGKKVVKDFFSVQSIEYDSNRKISGLIIVNQKGSVVYQYFSIDNSKLEKIQQTINENQATELLAELKRTGISLPSVLKKHKLKQVSEMPVDLWRTAMTVLAATPDKAA